MSSTIIVVCFVVSACAHLYVAALWLSAKRREVENESALSAATARMDKCIEDAKRAALRIELLTAERDGYRRQVEGQAETMKACKFSARLGKPQIVYTHGFID